ncbi:FAD-dependent monooxygenase [bacterium]|nr:FAD-dependent monooxygenase [bacterium]
MAVRSVAVAGCGIAGLAAATCLARAGWRVVAFDRLDAPEPIGSGLILQPVGLAVLDAMGLGAVMRDLGAPIQRLFGRAEPSGRTVLDVRYRRPGDTGDAGLGVHRGALFALLLEAARSSGVQVETSREVAAAGDGRLQFQDGGVSARFDLVVDALGSRSPLGRAPAAPLPFGALWASLDWVEGFDEAALEQRYERASKMVGVMPIGRLPGDARRQAAFFWSLRQDGHERWLSEGLDAWKQDALALWPETRPLLDQIDEPGRMVFARYAHRTLRSAIGGAGVVHVGDSWHSTSPQLGQGANMALLDVLALATSLGAGDDLDAALRRYDRARRWHIRLYQAASYLFTPAYQSSGGFAPWVRDWLMSPVSRIPPAPAILAGLVSGRIGSPLAAIERAGWTE